MEDMLYLSASYEPRRSRSRRRRSSASEHDGALSKFPRTDSHQDISPYRHDLESKQVCVRCESLDLDGIIASRKHIPNTTGEFKAYMTWDLDSSCMLCKFLRSMRIPQPSHGQKPAVRADSKREEHGYHLRAFSGMSSYREYFSRPSKNKRPHSADIMLAVVPNGMFSDKGGHHHYVDTFGAVGYILPVAYSSRAPWLTGRAIDPDRVNFPLVQEWLNCCRKKHSCGMRYSRPDKLKMIDCKTMEIVTAQPNCNYFALSYVWGNAPTTTASTTKTPSQAETLTDLAPVVRDAITVVKSLGKRFLWVDKYCIPQNDSKLKSEQIRKMDLIYEGAFCTIVAAAGTSDQHGLPGISVKRPIQPSFKSKDSHFVSTLPDPQREIKKSTWMTRAWTYQEALCSGRRLIFTEHQVYFECKAMHCCESVEIPLNLLHSTDGKSLQSYVRPVLFRDEWLQGTHRFGSISAFWNVVKYYSTRKMTYDSDALNALEGILRRFQSSPSFVYNIMGIPLPTTAEADKESLLAPNLFIAGLSWHHTLSPRRRPLFPSWSWAGWEGAVELQRTFGSLQYETNLRLYVEHQDGTVFEWPAFWDGFWTLEGKAQCYKEFGRLMIEGDVFKVQLKSRIVHPHQQTSSKGPLFDMVSPYDGTRYAIITLPIDMINSPRLKNGLWDCVLLGAKVKAANPDVMLIRWNLDVAERLWAGTLLPRKGHQQSLKLKLPPMLRKKFRLE